LLRQDALYQLSLYMTEHLQRVNQSELMRYMLNADMALDAIRYVYNHFGFGSPLRQFFVDSFCASNRETHDTGYMLINYPKDFLVDVMIQRAKLVECVDSFAQAMERMEEWKQNGEKAAQNMWMTFG
jgi:hypothetical protein